MQVVENCKNQYPVGKQEKSLLVIAKADCCKTPEFRPYATTPQYTETE